MILKLIFTIHSKKISYESHLEKTEMSKNNSYLNHIFNLLQVSLLPVGNVLCTVALLVILANALDESTCFTLFDSPVNSFFSTNSTLFSAPLLWICLFLLTSRRGSVPLSKSEPILILLLS